VYFGARALISGGSSVQAAQTTRFLLLKNDMSFSLILEALSFSLWKNDKS
jgi:hypothetical protein